MYGLHVKINFGLYKDYSSGKFQLTIHKLYEMFQLILILIERFRPINEWLIEIYHWNFTTF